MLSDRITESELVIPSLYLLDKHPNGSLSTSELIPLLTEIFKPSGKDAEIINKRNDTYFSQKVRNLKSHDTLTSQGYAKYSERKYHITDLGRAYLKSNLDAINYLFSTGFDYNDVRRSLNEIQNKKIKIIHPYEEILIIEEGLAQKSLTTKYKRSSLLRKKAIEQFTHDGVLKCDCCDFEFSKFYGHSYGVNCIEIHHIHPIFQYEGKTVEKTIEEALKNLMPVCPNCHRVIHKAKISAEEMPLFKKNISHGGC